MFRIFPNHFCVLITSIFVTGCGVAAESPLSESRAAAEEVTQSVSSLSPTVESSDSEEWSRFRGAGGDGRALGDVPLSWGADENIHWKTPLSGPGASSPVVWGNQIYLTCYTGYGTPREPGGELENLNRHLMSFDRNTGNLIWDKSIVAKLPEEKSIRDHGYAANTPSVNEEGVYVFLGKTGVFAFDHSGKELWHTDVGSNTSSWGTSSSPLMYKDLLIVNASVESQTLVALNRKSGEKVWSADGIKEAWNTPIVVVSPAGRDELIICIHGKVLAYDPVSGEPLWTCDTDITWYMVPTPVEHDGVLYVLGGRSGTVSLAVKTGGSGNVTDTHRVWTSNKGSNVSSAVYNDGHLYWMNDQRAVAYCAKAETGEIVYEERIDRAGQIYSSPILVGDRIYYSNRSGKTFVVAANPEFKLLQTNDLRDGGQFNGSPAVDRHCLLIRSDNFLYCIGEDK